MNSLHHNCASLWTGSAIAAGVLDFAAAVITAGGTSRITLPVRTAAAAIAATGLVIGPGTEMVAVDLGPEPDEIIDDALVHELADAAEWWRDHRSRTNDVRSTPTMSDHRSTQVISDAAPLVAVESGPRR